MLLIAAVLLLGTALQEAVVDACRPDYTFVPTLNSCYKYHYKIVSWNEAKDTCQREDAYLFYPENKVELEQVRIILKIDTEYYLNIGFSDLEVQGEYRTLDGRPVSDVPVMHNSSLPDKMRCGAFGFTNSKFVVHDCDAPQKFVCKRFTSTTAEALQTANREVKDTIANTSNILLGALERQASIQSSLLERLIGAVGRQTEIQQNQTAVLELLQKAATNQATAFNRQSELIQRQYASLQRQATDLLAAMDRHTAKITAALELESSNADNISVRSDQ